MVPNERLATPHGGLLASNPSGRGGFGALRRQRVLQWNHHCTHSLPCTAPKPPSTAAIPNAVTGSKLLRVTDARLLLISPAEDFPRAVARQVLDAHRNALPDLSGLTLVVPQAALATVRGVLKDAPVAADVIIVSRQGNIIAHAG